MFPRERVATDARLPDWHDLLAAFGGHGGAQAAAHPVLRAAAALGELHCRRREQPGRSAEIDCCRMELIADIDSWVSARPGSAHRLRAESLGGVVDRMAAAHMHANRLLHSTVDVSDERVHTAWHRLAALADGWTDLVAALAHGDVPPPRRHAVG